MAQAERSQLSNMLNAILVAALVGCLLSLGSNMLQTLIWAALEPGLFVPALFAVVYAAPFAVIIAGVLWFLGLGAAVLAALPFGAKTRGGVWPLWTGLFAGGVGLALSLAGYTIFLLPWATDLAASGSIMAPVAVAVLYAGFGAIAGLVLQRRLG